MSFSEKYNYYFNLLSEQDENQQDAAEPATPETQPTTPADATTPVAPEGYVNLVKILAKSLAMNIPIGEIDALFSTTTITPENAFQLQDQFEQFLKENEVKSDNIERLNNINYKKFVETTTANNFALRLKHLVSAMKKRDPYINEI